MKLPKNLFLRKLIIVPFLALAGIIIGEVYQRITMKTPEEVLMALGAQQVMSQSMNVNGAEVLADVWQLPEFASSASLHKLNAKVITVGKIVYVFHDDFAVSRGQCVYPNDLPRWDITCHYVIDAGHSRFVSGVSTTLSAEQLRHAFATSAEADGWTSVTQNVWQKEKQTIILHVSENERETCAMLAVKKDL